jgi:hypothetical protein
MENKAHQLTIEEVRASGDYDHLTDEEVQNIIDSLYELSLILYDMYIKEQR